MLEVLTIAAIVYFISTKVFKFKIRLFTDDEVDNPITSLTDDDIQRLIEIRQRGLGMKDV